MPLILAIEPDQRQAAQLADLVHHRLRAELVHADTTERALVELAQIGDRVPDLILVPSLLSAQEDAALAAALRVIATAANVQMLTIPLLADPEQPPQHRGVFARWRQRKSTSPGACDPAVFAEQIATYLAEAAASRADDNAEDETETTDEVTVEAAPAPVAAFEPVLPSVLLETRAPELFVEVPAIVVEPPAEAEADAQAVAMAVAEPEPEPEIVEEVVPRVDVDLVQLVAAADAVPAADDLTMRQTEPAPETPVVAGPVWHALVVDFTTLQGVSLLGPTEDDMTPERVVLPAVVAAAATIEIEPAIEVAPAIEVTPLIDAAPAIEAVPVIEVELTIEAQPAIERQPAIEIEAAIWAEDAIDVQGAAAASVEAEPEVEADDTEPATVDLLIAPLLREMEAARAPVAEVTDVVVAPEVVVAPISMVAEPILKSAPEPTAEPIPQLAPEPEPDPMFFAEDDAPRPSERPAWVELIESLRKDIERLRSERAEAAAPVQAAKAPRPPRRRVESKQEPRPAAAYANRLTLPRRRKVARPIQDQWGLFDPEQCGFGALLAKLDQISAREDASA